MKQGEAQQGDAKQAAAERDAATARRDEAMGPDEGRPNDSKALGFDGTRRSHSMHEAGIDGNVTLSNRYSGKPLAVAGGSASAN